MMIGHITPIISCIKVLNLSLFPISGYNPVGTSVISSLVSPPSLESDDDYIKREKVLVTTPRVSKGIRQWQIDLCTSPMIIHKIIPYVDYN